MFTEFWSLLQNEVLRKALATVWSLWPVWLPLLLIRLAFDKYLEYKRREWIKAQGSALIEILLPNEMLKSPAAMEVFLQALHQAGVGTLTDVYFKGRVRSWFSLELVSDGGRVHSYIWMHAKWKKSVETQLYSLFPNIEVKEVSDYALDVHYDTAKYKFSKMTHMVLNKPDAYPLKTYIDYGLDKDPKEEYKNDPIAPMIEFLGSLKPGEQAWIQILIQAHGKEGVKYGRLVTKPDWKVAANEEIKKILKEARLQTEVAPDKYDPKYLTDEQKEVIKAIERSLSKPAFDTMVRAFYFSTVETNNPNNIGGLLGSFKAFGSGALNGFKPGKGADYDYPWEDFGGIRRRANEIKFLEAYKRRSFFYPPFKNLKRDKSFVLTTEELATIYHFPSSMVVATPTLSRIPSKKAEAPANLPI